VPKDLAKAAELYQKAADQGYASAQSNLGLAYELGLGVPKYLEKARELYQKAAAQNNEHAKEGLNRLSRGVGSIPRWVYLIILVLSYFLRNPPRVLSKRFPFLSKRIPFSGHSARQMQRYGCLIGICGIVLVPIGFYFIAASANASGRSERAYERLAVGFIGFGILCVVLSAIGILVGVVYEMRSAMRKKKCPFCAELIKKDARECRYCGRNVGLSDENASPPSN